MDRLVILSDLLLPPLIAVIVGCQLIPVPGYLGLEDHDFAVDRFALRKVKSDDLPKDLKDMSLIVNTVRDLCEPVLNIVQRPGDIQHVEDNFCLLSWGFIHEFQGSESVSYTHLRAHETRHDLVCRLLLEKK